MANEKEQKEKKFGDYIQFTPDTGGGKKLDPNSQAAQGVVLLRDGQDDATWEDMIDRAEKQGKLGKVKFTKKDGTQVYNEGPPPADKETSEAMDAISAGRRPLSKKQQEIDKKSMLDTGMRARHPQPSTRQIEAENASENWDSWTNKPKTSPGLAPVKYAPPGESFEDMQARGDAEHKALVDERIASQTELERNGQIAPGPAGVPLRSLEEQAADQTMALKHAPTTPIGPGQPEGSGLMDFMGAVATANSLNPFATEAPKPREGQAGAPLETAPQDPDAEARMRLQASGGGVPRPGAVKLDDVDLIPLLEAKKNLKEFTKQSLEDAADAEFANGILKSVQRRNANKEREAAVEEQKMMLRVQRETKESIQKDVGIRAAFLAKAERAAATEIDPARYWNNKSLGSKALGLVAGALFGFAGKGMEYLKQLDELVAQDMRAQEGDRDSKVKGLMAQADGKTRDIQTLREAGLDEGQVHNLMADRYFKSMQAMVEQMAMGTQDMERQMRMREVGAALLNRVVQGEETYVQRAQERAANKAQVEFNNAKLKQEADIADAKLRMELFTAGTGKPKKALSPAQTAEINNVKTGYNAVQKALTIVGKDGYIMRNLKQLGNDGLSSDGELYNKLRSHLTEVVAQLDKAGALSKDELKFFSSQVAKQGDFNAKETLTQLSELLADKYNTYVKNYGNSYDMEGFKPLRTEKTDEEELGAHE